MAKIVVLGAGVSGLTSALHLARNGHDVSIVAKHMPGDYDVEYASPWAGADYTPNLAAAQQAKSIPNSAAPVPPLAAQLEVDTWPELERLARHLPETGIHFQELRQLRRPQDPETAVAKYMLERLRGEKAIPEKQRSLFESCRELNQSELPRGYASGISLTSVCINTALYLPWLASQCLKRGATIRRGILPHITSAASLHHSGQRADIVINCTGLSSLHLGGVEDAALYPGRGQIVVVRNDPGIMYGVSGTDAGREETTYMMTRGAGGGCVLGGCLQANVWESQPDPNLAVRIMQRCVELCPAIVGEGQGVEGLSVVRHGVGLRPMRRGGIRLESEVVQGVSVVHNYGHGGCGYQTSYGAAEEVGRLVEKALKQKARI